MENNGVVLHSAELSRSKAEQVIHMLGLVLLVAASCAVIASMLWLKHTVPVSAADMKDASWLYGFQEVEHFAGLFEGLGVTMAVMGIAIGFCLKRGSTLVLSLAVGTVMFICGMPSVNFLIAVDVGTAKVGCFVWDTKECHAMLGFADNALPSMYIPRAEADKTGEVYTATYDKAIAPAREAASRFMPGFSAAIAPFVVFDTEALNTKLKAQRAEVARRRESDKGAAQPVNDHAKDAHSAS